jgi:hypothetical protein
VFGKHSGTAAVQAVLEKHAAALAAQGVALDDALVAAVLDRVKALRGERIATRHSARAIDDFYRNYGDLGIGEVGLVELALAVANPSARTPSS